jgi:uncharacterized tellurite resistance protein B-like protein
MFKNLKAFFESSLQKSEGESATRQKSLELAAAVLMLEISMADSDFADEERELIESIMIKNFHMGEDESREIIKLAEQEVDHAVSLHEFTRLVNETLPPEERIEIIELLWQVAYADAVLDKYEEYYIRKIADLLYVSHSDYIKAKHRAFN